MAQTGYSKVQIYSSSTATHTPSAGNLTNDTNGSELAINITDGKLFYKDNAGAVQVLATKGAGTIGGSNTQVQYNSSGTFAGSANLTFDGTTLTSSGFSGPLNGTVGATTANTGKFTTITGTLDASISGLTVGKGSGSVSTNTAVGASALAANTTGSVNSVFGYQAGYSLTTGTYNNFFGENAAYYQTTGSYNIAIGQGALQGVSGQSNTGSNNTAVGNNALLNNTTASNNTAVGYQAGYSNTTGTLNTFVGRLAGYPCTTGSYNTCLGDEAGYGTNSLISGSYNTIVGYAVSTGGSTDTYEIVVGSGALIVGKGSGTGFIAPGSTSGTGGGGVYQGNNSTLWSVTSDERLKKNIVDNTVGLTAINGIKVRNFEYRLPEEITDLDKSNAVNITGTQLGPIAQELQQVLPDCVKTESTGVMSVDSSDVLWHLVTAVQQLSAQVTALQAKVGV